MDMPGVVLLGVAAALLALVLRAGRRADIAVIVAIAAGVVILGYGISRLSGIVGALEDIARRGDVSEQYFSTILKIVGVATLAEFGAYACRDAGEPGLAQKIEFGGKVGILALSLPVLTAMMELVLSMLP